MTTPMRLGLVFLAFGAVVLLIPLIDSTSDSETTPIGAALLIAGLLLFAVGAAKRTN